MTQFQNLEHIDIESLFEDCLDRFEGERPTSDDLSKFALSLGFGVSEAIALGSLLFAIWSRYNPKKDNSIPVCKHLVQTKKRKERKKCGSQFVSVETTGSNIIMYCYRKHVTRMRLK